MKDTLQKKILMLALKAGELMMKSGAEMYRVEDTIRRICLACGIRQVDSFAIPTGIILSIDSGREEQIVHTSLKRVQGGNIDLHKISAINDFSRIFTTTNMSVDRGLERLEEISATKIYPVGIRMLGAALVCAFYCAFLSADLIASICAVFVGLASYGVSLFLDRYGTNYFIKGFCCCGTSTLLAVFCHSLGLTPHYGSIIIGTIILFFPGAAITNSIRDLLSGDMLSGVARMSEAFLIAVSLASGAGVIISLLSLIGLTTLPPQDGNIPLSIQILLAVALPLGFAMLFHLPKKHIIPAIIISAGGWAIYLLTFDGGRRVVLACFLGSCMVGLLSGLASRLLKEASTVFIIPGIMTMVPGAGMYFTMLALITGNYESALPLGTKTIFMAGAIALGVMISGGFFKITSAIHRKLFTK